MTKRFLYDHKYLGYEFDWLSTNTNGELAYFSTAGEGPIPEVLNEIELNYDLLGEILLLPKIGKADIINKGEYKIDDWYEVAIRGIYAYDWSYEIKQYLLIAKPHNVININEIFNEKLIKLAKQYFFMERFVDEIKIGIREKGN